MYDRSTPCLKTIKLLLFKVSLDHCVPAYAQSAPRLLNSISIMDNEGFQKVTHKKRIELVLSHPRARREIIFEMGATSVKAADPAIRITNKTIVDHKDVMEPPFILSKTIPGNKLVLTTAINHQAIDYEQYLTVLNEALAEVEPVGASTNARWTKPLAHSVPTYATLGEVRCKIKTNYLQLKMGQTPRWLMGPQKREGKAASAMVLIVAGTMTLEMLGVTHLVV